jgi:hypothetical protein
MEYPNPGCEEYYLSGCRGVFGRTEQQATRIVVSAMKLRLMSC